MAAGRLYSNPMQCEERQRLTNIYLEAVAENAGIGIRIANMKSETWREATEETRVLYQAKLSDINSCDPIHIVFLVNGCSCQQYSFFMARYRLRSPIIGVQRSSSGMRLIEIGAGEILIVPGTDQTGGLVEIVHRGKNVSVFIQDVADRGECIERIDVKPLGNVVIISARENKAS
jgi:hypothetical protein